MGFRHHAWNLQAKQSDWVLPEWFGQNWPKKAKINNQRYDKVRKLGTFRLLRFQVGLD